MPLFEKLLKGSAQVVGEEANSTNNSGQAGSGATGTSGTPTNNNGAQGQGALTPGTPATPAPGSTQPLQGTDVVFDVKKAKEEENRRKREEFMKQRLKEMQAEEQKVAKYNKLKIQDIWLELLRREKATELKKNIEIIAQTHDRQVDRKDAVIQILYRDLSEAEEQYRLALRTHLQHVDELLALHHKHMASLEDEFRTDLQHLQQEFEEEKKEFLQKHKEEVAELEEMRKEMQKRDKKLNDQIMNEFLRNKETIKNAYSQKHGMQKLKMEGKIGLYQEQIRKDNNNHCNEMDGKFSKYLQLRESDDTTTEQIKKQTKVIKIKEENLAHWKAKWLNNLRECEERNKKLTDEKNALNKHFKELKKKMDKFRTSETKRLKELVTMSHETIKVLKEKVGQAERILQLGELTKKLETEREKILPFEHFDKMLETNNEGKELSASASELNAIGTVHTEGTVAEWEKLGKFYSKYNKVMLDRVALEQEKQHLIEENQKLRQMLKEYLDGISVNEDVLSNRNPLLIVEHMQPKMAGFNSRAPVMVNAGGAGGGTPKVAIGN